MKKSARSSSVPSRRRSTKKQLTAIPPILAPGIPTSGLGAMPGGIVAVTPESVAEINAGAPPAPAADDTPKRPSVRRRSRRPHTDTASASPVATGGFNRPRTANEESGSTSSRRATRPRS